MKGVPCFVQKNHYGYWVISDFDNQDRLVTIKYLYYTKKEAIKCFKQELSEINAKQTNKQGVTR
jgi:hypothetical protein